MLGYTPFEWFTLFIWIFVLTILIYGIIAIHDIPAHIARKRNHPHADAIEAAGWVSLFTLHVLWPFLWIWAMTYKPEKEQGIRQNLTAESETESVDELKSELRQMQERLDRLEAKES